MQAVPTRAAVCAAPAHLPGGHSPGCASSRARAWPGPRSPRRPWTPWPSPRSARRTPGTRRRCGRSPGWPAARPAARPPALRGTGSVGAGCGRWSRRARGPSAAGNGRSAAADEGQARTSAHTGGNGPFPEAYGRGPVLSCGMQPRYQDTRLQGPSGDSCTLRPGLVTRGPGRAGPTSCPAGSPSLLTGPRGGTGTALGLLPDPLATDPPRGARAPGDRGRRAGRTRTLLLKADTLCGRRSPTSAATDWPRPARTPRFQEADSSTCGQRATRGPGANWGSHQGWPMAAQTCDPGERGCK